MNSLLISHTRGLIKKHPFISYCWRDCIFSSTIWSSACNPVPLYLV